MRVCGATYVKSTDVTSFGAGVVMVKPETDNGTQVDFTHDLSIHPSFHRSSATSIIHRPVHPSIRLSVTRPRRRSKYIRQSVPAPLPIQKYNHSRKREIAESQ